MIYDNRPEHTFVRTYIQQNACSGQKQHRKMKEKSAGGSNLADLILCISYIELCQYKFLLCKKFTKIFIFSNFVSELILPVFVLYFLLCVPGSFFSEFSFLDIFLCSIPCYTSNIVLTVSFNLRISYSHLILSRFSIVLRFGNSQSYIYSPFTSRIRVLF